jgi:hypothetical protein
MIKKYKIGYMCSTAFVHELESTDVKIYPTLKALKESMLCCAKKDICEPVKVKIVRLKNQKTS